MKKLIVTLSVILFTMTLGFSQKYVFVDTEYILSKIPSYEAAQKQLDELSVGWQKDIEAIYGEIDKMYKDYQSEKVLLTEEMRTKRENSIINKEKEVKELQKKRFGKSGDLYKKRQELVKPIQDQVFDAIKEVATEGNWAGIFDTANNTNLLYSDPKYDKSDEVLKKLGYKN